MKYLSKREEFLKEYRKINEAFDMSGSGSGPMGNDINWGDSLIGRLINSTIRVAKIKYNAMKVDTLLNDFKAQLDLILVESLSRDDRSEFFILQLKGFLNQVDNICTSTKEEKEKLEDLLGSSDGNSLWDPKNPMRGKWDNIVKDGLLRTIHDRIEFDFNEEIVKVAGFDKDSMANSISDLIDILREYAYILDNPGATPTPRKTFPVRFYGLLKKYKNLFMNQNNSFKLKGYLKFIKEKDENIKPIDDSIEKKANLVFVENFRTIADIYIMYHKQKEESRKAYKPTKKEDISKLSAEELKAKLNDPAYSKEKEKIKELILQKEKGNNESIDYSFLLENKSNPILTSIKSLYNVIRSEGGEEAIKDLKNIKSLPSGQVMQVNLMNLMNKLYRRVRRDLSNKFNLGIADSTNTSHLYEKMDVLLGKESLGKAIVNLYSATKDVDLNTIGSFKDSILRFNKTMQICLEPSLLSQKKQDDSTQKQAQSQVDEEWGFLSEILNSFERDINDSEKEGLISKLNKGQVGKVVDEIIKNTEQDGEDRKESNELLSNVEKITKGEERTTESLKIYENVSNLNIDGLWRKWVKDTGIPENLIRVTQQEIDKLDAMLKGKMDSGVLTFNPRKTPDPIINIIRIFKRAHDLYYTDVIPSGRGNGRVSNKTFREYEKLGTGTTSQSGANEPGYGPWAVKSIRNTWVDGVTKILEDQEYRKIFANKNFRVAGSEDTFNESISYRRYIKLILEEIEDKDDKSPKSQGQILFDFITDMLSKDTAVNFDKERNTLLKKYFGSSITLDKEADKGRERDAPRPTIPTDPNDDKTIFWYPISRYGVDIININSDEGPVIMLPYVNINSGANTELMKFHIIKQKKITGKKSGTDHYCYIVKIFKEVKDWKSGKTQYDNFKVSNDDEVGITEAIGILHKTSGIKDKGLTSGKLKLIYIVNKSLSGLQEIEIQSTSSFNKSVPSVLYKKDVKEIQIQEKEDDINPLLNEISKLEKEMENAL
jgi:hypothetical protein